MSDKPIFVDTNLLVYAHDKDAGAKHRKACTLIADLWHRPIPPSVSVQVLQELYVNLVRKGVPARQAEETVSDYLSWDVIANDAGLLQEGMRMSQRWQVSLWDGLILAAARQAQAAVVWSEDLSPGQDYGGVTVVNHLAEE